MWNFLKVVPGWVWVVLAILLVLFVGLRMVDKIEDQAKTITSQESVIEKTAESNKKLDDEIRRLSKDQLDRETTNHNITQNQQKVEESFADLDTKLAAAVAERNALDAAVNAHLALEEDDVKVAPSVPKKASQPAAVKNPKDGVEVDIAWEAYCLDNTSPQCTTGVLK